MAAVVVVRGLEELKRELARLGLDLEPVRGMGRPPGR
jgi:hypothetical protein